jgi:hypothetical protein
LCLSGRADTVDINILCHLISIRRQSPQFAQRVSLWFLTIIFSPPDLHVSSSTIPGSNISTVAVATSFLINKRRRDPPIQMLVEHGEVALSGASDQFGL